MNILIYKIGVIYIIIIFHRLLWYHDMSSEIIPGVAYDNHDDLQHVNFVFFTKFHFPIMLGII